MDSLHPQIDAQAIPQPGYAVPREGFSFTVRPRELLLALLSYPVAYLYIEAFDIGDLTGKKREIHKDTLEAYEFLKQKEY